jgi:hypothetical protein
MASRIVIDLKKSGSTERVIFMPQALSGSGAEKLCLKLSSADQVGFRKEALAGTGSGRSWYIDWIIQSSGGLKGRQ